MANIVVIGAQWGDEGKGKVVDLYTSRADCVVRFNGGNNAGHTIIIEGQKTILHHVPSGIMHPGKCCLIGNGVVIYPEVLLAEIDDVKSKGRLTDDSQLKISEQAHVIMPYHRSIDHAREVRRGVKKIGTTGRGIGPCYEDKAMRSGIRMGDLINEDVFRERLTLNIEAKNDYLTKVLGADPVEFNEVFELYLGYADRLRTYVTNVSRMLEQSINDGKSILFEGAQGALLDIDHGTFPFVTSSSVVAGAAATGSGVGPKVIDEVIGISKAYTTRVGGGPFPTEQDNEVGHRLADIGKEFGSTTGRRRRTGWWDGPAMRHARRVNGFTGLAVTKLDVLTGLESIDICTSYLLNGEKIDDIPSNLIDLEKCVPQYESLPGWSEDISKAEKLADLPPAARSYLDRIEEISGVELVFIGVGAQRSEAIVLREVI